MALVIAYQTLPFLIFISLYQNRSNSQKFVWRSLSYSPMGLFWRCLISRFYTFLCFRKCFLWSLSHFSGFDLFIFSFSITFLLRSESATLDFSMRSITDSSSSVKSGFVPADLCSWLHFALDFLTKSFYLSRRHLDMISNIGSTKESNKLPILFGNSIRQLFQNFHSCGANNGQQNLFTQKNIM